MIRLSIKKITEETTAHLQNKQADVDGRSIFAEKIKRAELLWNSKTGSLEGDAAFKDIKKKLIAMCTGVEICNYCENNEATDIEHLYPKKFYPESAFRWDNYILACKICNMTWKSDKFAILDPAGSDMLVELPRRKSAHPKPVNNDGALINPRTENPTEFLVLDIKGKTFRFSAANNITNRNKVRANYTRDLLGLNNRNALVEARRAAAHYFLDRLEKFIRVKNAQNIHELELIASDPDAVDNQKLFEMEKNRIMQAITDDIKKYSHPTVWIELKRQRNELIKTKRLFEQAPEALTW